MEVVDLYDDKKRNMGKKWLREDGKPRQGENLQVVHIWIINSKGELLIQKRQEGVRSHAGKWAYTSGIVDTGESSLEGATREVKEELGIETDMDKIQFLLSFKRKHNFVDVWLIEDDINIADLKLQQEEVSQAKYVSQTELERIIKNGDFVPGIEIYYELFARLLERYHIQDGKKVEESKTQNTQDEER